MADPMTTNEARWTHRAYFKRFRLSVEQYGEILVAEAFGGTKKGDAQPCFDVETTVHIARTRLLISGASSAAVERCLERSTGPIRIEVKSKQVQGASVIHCSDNKIAGSRKFLPATHFAVLLFNCDGSAHEAWFFAADIADQLRRKETKSRYIPVRLVRQAAADGLHTIIDLRTLVNNIASSALPQFQLQEIAKNQSPRETPPFAEVDRGT